MTETRVDVPFYSGEATNGSPDIAAAVERVMRSQRFILGEEVAAFEREFAAWCGAGQCVGVANGTDALEIALRALGVGPGDAVILAANAGFYGSAAVRQVGAEPRYADVEDESLNLDPREVRRALDAGARAVIVTHLYGRMAAVEEIVALAGERGVPVIEDCAQAHGARRGGRRAGSIGTVGCFSFYPTKNLGALGDGGAIVTSVPEIAGRARGLRQYGWGAKYRVEARGGRNSRLDELQAAILRAKLPRLDAWNAARREIAREYTRALAPLGLRCPAAPGEDHAGHLYVARHRERDRLRAELAALGVPTDVHYPVPDHRQPAYAGTAAPRLPVTEAACGEVFSLPCYPGLDASQVAHVIDAVAAAVRRCSP